MAASLRSGTALYAGATLLDRLLALLLLPLLTRTLAPHEYGAWTQTLVAAGLLLPVVLLASPTAIVRWFAGAGRAGSRVGHFRRVGAAALGLYGLAAGLVWLAREPVAGLVYGEVGRAALVPALLGLLLADATIEYANAWLRAAGRIGLVAGVLVLCSLLRYGLVLGLAGVAPLAAWLGRYTLAQGLLALGVLALCAAVLRRGAAAGGSARAEGPTPRVWLGFCTPLVALALFTTFSASFDRFLLVELLGLDVVAVYSAAVSLCSVPAVYYSVLGFTLFPELARQWADGRHDEAARLSALALQAFVFLCLPSALALALAGPQLLPLLSTAHYEAPPAVYGLLGVSVAAFGVYQILLYALLLDGRSTQVLKLAVAAALLNATINLLLAPRWGLAGAAAAAAATNTVMAAWAARWAAQVMPWSFPWAGLRRVLLGCAAAAVPMALVLAWPAGPAGAAGGAAAWARIGLALGCGAAIYLGLDLGRPGSIARMLLKR